MKKYLLLIVFFALLINISVLGQSGVGKLAGQITDTDTKEPLIGANVIIVGTDLGAATNIDGAYFILNIQPGSYDVRVSYVGYGEKLIQGVRVVGGITYELNVDLNSGIELQEVVVTDKKLFEEKSTNTVRVLDKDQIARIPVKGIEQLASLQAGVVMEEGSGGAGGNATINVRGGRGAEVLYIVDGVVQNDILYGQNYSQVSNASIEQLSFQVGGFEAKYGQSQSGIVNVTTKTGGPAYSIYADVLTSSFTDDYGYNLYTGNIGGPIIPGQSDHTIFLSGERGWFLDGSPSAIGVDFPSINYSSTVKPNNSEGIWRFSGKTYHSLGDQFIMRLSGSYNSRDFRSNILTDDIYFLKSNAASINKVERDNLSLTAKFSQNLWNSSFYDITFGFKGLYQEEGHPVYWDDLEAYGDTLKNPYIPRQSDQSSLEHDNVGIFQDPGFIDDTYRKINNNTYSIDGNFTSQIANHLLEFGGGFNYNISRYYRMLPTQLASYIRDYVDTNGDTVLARSREERFSTARPLRYGYDLYGNEIGSDDSLGAATPILAYGYVQERFELEDLVLNLGVRFDYFDTRGKIFKDQEHPYAGGSNPNDFDDGDYIEKDPEFYVSPRIGIGFPVTESTVLHVQYGTFIQQPRFFDAILFESRAWLLQNTTNFQFNDGYINSERTTQYEVGFRQIFGNNIAAMNITAFYKNTEGLTNTQTQYYYRQYGGERLSVYGAANTDFGTVKGLAFSLDVPRLNYFAFSLNYTLSLAEGTGSSQNSSFVAAFRNPLGEIPKVIAPLDFDQRHTGIVAASFLVPEDDLGFLELTALDIIFSFNSGRPYTPLAEQNLTEDNTNWGETKGYVNSRFSPGTFRIDLKLEKSFRIAGGLITPYLWIENLLGSDNPVNVWRSTGDPYSTEYLLTETGKKLAADNGEDWVQDYKSLERDPDNFGIPRFIKLGLKVNFSNL